MAEIRKYDGGFKIFGYPVGQIKALAERFKNYLSWFQFPILIYTAFMSTLNFFPGLAHYNLVLFSILCFIGFIIFSIACIYIDYKWVFPSEKNFLFSAAYFDEKFGELKLEVESLK